MDNSPAFSSSNVADIMGALDQSAQVCFVVDDDLRLTYCNPAWNQFAIDNGAPQLVGKGAIGINLRQVIAEELRPFYEQAFEKVARDRSVWDCLYECSSPQVFRKFQMRIHPFVPAGAYLITNSLVVERAHAVAVDHGLEGYVNADGQITMCSHCRCSRRPSAPDRWDFVPLYLEQNLENVSHSLCPVCLEYFYPKPEDY